MSLQNTIVNSNGQVLTGRLWRQDHPFFADLPFYSDIARMDDMGEGMDGGFVDERHRHFKMLLLKMAKGLDVVHPFSDTIGVDGVLRDADKMLSPNMETVGPKNAGRIWGFVSKFVMLDRFAKTLFGMDFHTGFRVPRRLCSEDFLGTGTKLLEDLTPPTKLLRKFMKTWGDRQTTRTQYTETVYTSSSMNEQSHADVALTISKRLIDVVKVKNILHIEAGMAMISLAMAISSENDGVFPELAVDVKNVLRRIWLDRMDPLHFEQISEEIQSLHKPMKNIIEIVSATSPLLALSTHGWTWNSIHRTYLLRIFVALGNDRPQILVELENRVLEGVIAISEGRSPEDVLDSLYSQVLLLEKDLSNDVDAMNWFNLITNQVSIPPTPPPSVFPSTPSTGYQSLNKNQFQGLRSPPDSCLNTPIFPVAPKPSDVGNGSPCLMVDPSEIFSNEYFMDDVQGDLLVRGVGDPFDDGLGDLGNDGGDSIPQGVVDENGQTDVAVQLKDPSGDDFNNEEPCRSEKADDVVMSKESSLGSEENVDDVAVSKESSLGSEENVQDVAVSKESSSGTEEKVEENQSKVSVESNDGFSGSQGEKNIGAKETDEIMAVDVSRDSSGSQGEKNVGAKENDEIMAVDESRDSSSDRMDVDEDVDPAVVVNSKGSSKPVSNEGAVPSVRLESNLSKKPQTIRVIKAKPTEKEVAKTSSENLDNSNDRNPDSSVPLAAAFELPRSIRSANSKNNAPYQFPPTPKSSRSKRKSAQKKEQVIDHHDSDDEMLKLCEVEKAEYHPTICVDIAGWGSTVEAGAKPYRHTPVQIIPPANVASTGDDSETLRKVEALIQAEFRDGLPPHLQSNAKSMSYSPGSDQSRIFVASHSEFTRLHARDIQKILRERVILVHGNTFDYNYGWDLESMGRLYDVDRKTTVHVATLFDHDMPKLRHHEGTLRELYDITTTFSEEDCPPLNAISLPAYPRNLYVPCQFGSVASHEVAQSRIPSDYDAAFDVPVVKPLMEWSLVGGRGAISPFHMDSEGFGSVVVVLEGSKYWILATRLGDDDTITSIDSLGAGWNPYKVNEGDNVNRFRFEAVHLQKGDMLIMPGGVPHWVLGTSNAICVGRHFYSASTIRSSVIGIVHTFLLTGSVTNEDLLESRTLLYQMMVFWSMRIDKRDVDGAHIPDLSSVVGFFDVLYLGIFIILSAAFDHRFYQSKSPPTSVVVEMAHAVGHFYRLFHIFSMRYILVLDGEVVAYSYVVDRMLAEFSAAVVNFSAANDKTKDGDNDDEEEVVITTTMFRERIEAALKESHSQILPYYSRCLDGHHKHFTWTGPELQIFPRSEDISSIIPLISLGERWDLPSHNIYGVNSDPSPPCSPDVPPVVGKRRDQDDGPSPSDEMPKKRTRRL